MAQDEFLTSAEVCARFRISESHLSRLLKAGDITGYRLSPRVIRYSAADIERFLEHAATGQDAS